jgi:folate-binding protein YgfZ
VTTWSEDGPIARGKAFVDLSGWRKIGVSGGDAIEWLNDLVTADLSDLGPNRARRALLLTPTGRIRADVTVAVAGDSVLVLQDPAQPEPIDRLLSRYVLSSDVELDDRTTELCLFAFPNRETPPSAAGTAFTTPSCLGQGVDLTALSADRDRLIVSMSKAFTAATDADVEGWRVAKGIPRFGTDGLPEDLPQEAGVAGAVSFDKGCYLGQEAVAKVRNLGHPRRLLLHLWADGEVRPGETVFRDGGDAGRVTSTARSGTGTIALARVRWSDREGPFVSPSGVRFAPVEGTPEPAVS